MQLLCQYPMTEAMVTPHCGKPVMAVTHSGHYYYGMLERCADGQLYLVPASAQPGPAAVQSIRKKLSAHPGLKHSNKKAVMKLPAVKAWGYPYGGYGYPAGGAFAGGFAGGLAGAAIALPLIALAGLFALPFFWI